MIIYRIGDIITLWMLRNFDKNITVMDFFNMVVFFINKQLELINSY
jgi:hypothetical protein